MHNHGSLPRTSQTSKTGCLRQPPRQTATRRMDVTRNIGTSSSRARAPTLDSPCPLRYPSN
jgi:hypothetical protein